MNEELRNSIKKELEKSIISITNQFGAIQKIIVFGSFVNGGFNKFSDIDMYMMGLGAEDYFEVKRILEDMIDTDVDLYNDSDREEYIEKIKKRGVLIYERKTGIIDSQPS